MDSRFAVSATPLAGLMRLQRIVRRDDRGFLERLLCVQELAPVLGARQVRQVNRSLTRQAGSIRGMHYQHPPHSEMKIVSCLRGAVLDVAVDLRAGSPTFLQWHAEELSAGNHVALVIPEGFAHGFQTLEDDCELLYFHTADYAPAAEAGLDALDPRLAIPWPLSVTDRSARDESHPLIDERFKGL